MRIKALAAVTSLAGALLIIYGTIASLTLFMFGLTALLIVPLTALLCRYRVTRGKRVSYGTAIASAFEATLLTFIVTFSFGDASVVSHLRVARLENWTLEYGTGLLAGFILWVIVYLFPALGVVHLYQKQAVRKYEA
jgi:hypothetical protein